MFGFLVLFVRLPVFHLVFVQLATQGSGEDFDLGFELVTPGVQGREDRTARLTVPIIAPTNVATIWVLLPPGRPYRDVDLVG